MQKKYLVIPGKVTSQTDGDTHHIGAMRLIELYGVNPDECLILNDHYEDRMRILESNDRRGAPPPGYTWEYIDSLIWLVPRNDGNYTLEPEYVWYGMCGYWTDEWEKLKAAGETRIPCCPVCGAVGFQAEIEPWMQGAKDMNAKQPGYLKFLNDNKNKCFRGIGFMKEWEKYRNDHYPQQA